MRTTDRANASLPITAEVGGEGGSFADATYQVATFQGHVPRHDAPLGEDHQPDGGTDAAHGMRRYPTEPPMALPATAPSSWRTGLVGAAAGAAAGAAVALAMLKRRG